AVEDDYFDVMMVGFNFINHSALRHVLPAAKKKNVGIQAIYAVRGGLATFEAANKLIAQAIANGEVDPSDLDSREPLGFLLTEGGASSLPNACYRFCRHTPGADAVLTGTGNIEHLTENIESINDKPLPKSVVDKLLRTFARVESVT